MNHKSILLLLFPMRYRMVPVVILSLFAACIPKKVHKNAPPAADDAQFSDKAYNDSLLTPLEYDVLVNKATERPFTGAYYNFFEAGTYVCKRCGSELFSSDTKFEAHCGWPSFYDALNKTGIRETRDLSHGMVRIEVSCARCGGHLGHVFDDGPADKTGLRYCINSASLNFVAKGAYKKETDQPDSAKTGTVK